MASLNVTSPPRARGWGIPVLTFVLVATLIIPAPRAKADPDPGTPPPTTPDQCWQALDSIASFLSSLIGVSARASNDTTSLDDLIHQDAAAYAAVGLKPIDDQTKAALLVGLSQAELAVNLYPQLLSDDSRAELLQLSAQIRADLAGSRAAR